MQISMYIYTSVHVVWCVCMSCTEHPLFRSLYISHYVKLDSISKNNGRKKLITQDVCDNGRELDKNEFSGIDFLFLRKKKKKTESQVKDLK